MASHAVSAEGKALEGACTPQEKKPEGEKRRQFIWRHLLAPPASTAEALITQASPSDDARQSRATKTASPAAAATTATAAAAEGGDSSELKGNPSEKIRWLARLLRPACLCLCGASRERKKRKKRKVKTRRQGKKTLVLDLDETLVRSSLIKPPSYTFVVTVDLERHPRQIYIKQRPGLEKFLIEASKLFEIVIFTASVSSYADLVVDKIDPHRLCSFRLFRQYCTYSKGSYVKDLSLLGRDLKNVVIVDNSNKAYKWHTENAIPIKSWFDDPHDRELLYLIPILRSLAKVEDIRPVIRDAVFRSSSI